MQKANPKKNLRKPQQQSRPGLESKMIPQPKTAPTMQPGGGNLITTSLSLQAEIVE